MTIFCWLAGCSGRRMISRLTVEEVQVLDSIPSGSGLVVEEDTAFIVGDDATSIYRLMLSSDRQTRIPILGLDKTLYREAKAVKHDFESATFANWKNSRYLLALGSGSSSIARDSMLLLNLSDWRDQRIFSLGDFYRKLQAMTGTDSTQWNIEAATVVDGKLILCNRGNNLVINTGLGDFLEYVFTPGTPFPGISYYRLKLPLIRGKEARLSGACTLDDRRILFSASVEDTPDWITDGPVLGSFIGIYSMGKTMIDTAYLVADENRQPLPEKIESLDIRERKANGIVSVIAISDNDNGSSKLFHIRMAVKE